MGDVHSDGISHSNLYSIDFGDLDHSLVTPGDCVYRRGLLHGDSADSHSHVDVDGYGGLLDGCLDEGNGPCKVPCEGFAGVGVADGSEDVGSCLSDDLCLLVGVETCTDGSLEVDHSVDSHDGLSGCTDVDVCVRACLPEELDSPEGSDEVCVSCGTGGVEVLLLFVVSMTLLTSLSIESLW